MMELWKLSAGEIARLVRAREVPAREVAEAALRRLDAVNPRLNAIVECRPDHVLRQAARIDDMLARGEDPGPLAGVTLSVKINVDEAGFATSNGTRLQKDLIAVHDSPVVANLRRAGAVLIGRSNSPTFALRWFTGNLVHGKTLNPRDPGLTPGGSSGGAASAVAAGIGHIALGTDIGGSVRYPAYACGVHGLRAGLSRVPAYNESSPERPIGPQLMSGAGPIARTVDDLRLALEAMAMADPRDPWHAPVPLAGAPAPRRVALCVRPDGLPVAPEVEAALRDAARRLENRGWTVTEPAHMPSLQELGEIQEQLWLGDGFAALDDAVRRDADPGAAAVVEGVRARVGRMPPDVVARALLRRASAARAWNLFFQAHPVLLLPVSTELPFRDDLDLEGAAGFDRVWQAQLPMRAFPAIGLPGLAVTTGFAGTAPVGVQLVAARFREDLCLAAGADIEAQGERIGVADPR